MNEYNKYKDLGQYALLTRIIISIEILKYEFIERWSEIEWSISIELF